MLSQNPFVSVVIPAHNEESYISECLVSLTKQSYPRENYEIIVVNNASTDRTAELASAFDVNILYKKDGPVGAVRNYGASKARGEILAFIDSDCVAPERWIEDGVDLLKLQNDSVFGGGYLLRKHPCWIERFWLLENSTLPKDLLGGAIFISRKVFDGIGRFDESITSGEDSKISEALRSAGHKVIMKRELSVVHLGNPITLRHFIKRQIWHSENYFQNMRSSIFDLTFYILIVFLLISVLGVLFLFFGKTTSSTVLLLISALLPALFSAKRILRSSDSIPTLKGISFVYLLDLAYVIGRTVGLIKSFGKLFRSIGCKKHISPER